MEKFLLPPLNNSENENGRTLVERNSPAEAKEEEVEIIKEKLSRKRITPTPVLNKNLKIKKLKVKKIRGEKRKLPDGLDSGKKIKRKKKEKSPGNDENSNKNKSAEECEEVEIMQEVEKASGVICSTMTPVLTCRRIVKKKEFPVAENDSDMENGKRVEGGLRRRSSRKSKAIASSCRDTLNILLKLDSDILHLLAESFEIVKTHNLLDNKYISIDILIDLIALTLEKKRALEDVDSEKDLSLIISKCTSQLCPIPKRPKVNQNVTSVSQNVCHISQNLSTSLSPKNNAFQEGTSAALSSPNATNGGNEEVSEGRKEERKDAEEMAEKSQETDAAAKESEKSEETTVATSGKNFCITNYFKKLKKNVEERDKNERFSCFTTKTDMFLAPKLGGELKGERREEFERAFDAQNSESPYIADLLRRKRRKILRANVHFGADNTLRAAEDSEKKAATTPPPAETDEASSETSQTSARKRVALVRVDRSTGEPIEAVCRTKAKLLQFHDNRRPPYWGTWRRKSAVVGPRKPLGRDEAFNYEVDSDEEWEEEEEPGESLRGSDDEKEPDEDYEVDNEFFVPHGYLSDDENPEKENLSSKSKLELLEKQFTSEQKQKTRKMTPIVFGVFWTHQGIPSEGTFYEDLQIEKLQYVPWTSTTPIEIEEESEEPASLTKKPKQKIFPDEEIPDLIKIIHGSPHNCDRLARQFLLSRESSSPDAQRPGLTKVCVQKKIKELAAWQAGQDKGKMCWQVPRETRMEFGAADGEKTPEKKPRKCFFWNFVRKAEKSPESKESPSPAHPPPSIEPELLILES